MGRKKPFPLDKYHFEKQDNKIIASSTYAGKIVRAAASCHPEDEFSEEYGKQLAAARCGKKIAKKRFAAARDRKRQLFHESWALASKLRKSLDWELDAEADLDYYNALVERLINEDKTKPRQ